MSVSGFEDHRRIVATGTPDLGRSAAGHKGKSFLSPKEQLCSSFTSGITNRRRMRHLHSARLRGELPGSGQELPYVPFPVQFTPKVWFPRLVFTSSTLAL